MLNLLLGAGEKGQLSVEQLEPRQGGFLSPSFLKGRPFQIRADGEPEKRLQQWWCGLSGGGLPRWCSQKQLSHAGKERLHLAPCKRGVGTSCLGVTDGVFASLNNQTHQGQDTFFVFLVLEC